jgi:energy-coupling factor transporter ATP-binding protein EcfA2
MSAFPRGSTWRRWDLHVHTPLSIIQQYGGDTPQTWDAFIAAIKQLPSDVAVLAINDYLFIDGYEKLLTRRAEIPNIKLLLPCIEFRLNTFSGTANNHKRHNFHVLFDDSVKPQTIREQLLNCLSKGYKITDKAAWNRTPTPESLRELGRMVKDAAPAGNSIHNKSDLEVGFDNITYDRDEILGNLAKDCFQGRFLTAIGYSEWDQAKWDQSAVEKRTLINDAAFSLTCNDDVAKITEHVSNLKQNGLNSLVLHSSDAHSFARLGKTKLWIKADPTFAGLKQVVNEQERAFIGDAPPRFKQDHQVIDKVFIPSSAGWFADDFELELNDGLVAIIGPRGSGKSGLAEMIATAVGAAEPSDDSFVGKASKHNSSITGTGVLLTWADGGSSSGSAGERENDEGLVKYLPQKAVEQLCAPDNNHELVAQIENVIFQALGEGDRRGASGFADLKASVLRVYAEEKSSIASAVLNYNQEYQELTLAINARAAKERELAQKRSQLSKLNAELPKLPPADEKAQNDLSRLVSQKKLFEDKIVALHKTGESVIQLQTKVRVFQGTVTSFATELLAGAKAAGITELGPFTVSFDTAPILTALTARQRELERQIQEVRGGSKATVAALLGQSADSWTYANLAELSALIDKRMAETKAFETQKLKYQQQKAKIAATTTSIAALEAEIARIDKELKPRLEQVKEERITRYSEYFTALEVERIDLANLYEPLQRRLSQGSDTDRRLQFEAVLTYDIEAHLERGLAILDRTKRGRFRDVRILRQAIETLWRKYQKCDFVMAGIRDALNEFWKQFTTLPLENGTIEKIDIAGQLREGKTLQDFLDWFLELRHFSVTSSLKFDDTELYLLSPGQKGIVLLMLYLGLDLEDTRPLIIDQPEDNLDNMSVYRDLIRLFRERKKYRQIIVITHNPNLVVNTDAEQVVIAAYDGKAVPRISYSSGSLENQAEQLAATPIDQLTDGVIEKVCNILEGGPGAFSKRSKVYSLSPKIH